MADAVLTYTADANGGRYRQGRQIVTHGVLSSDNGDYPSAGHPVTAATFGLGRLDHLSVEGQFSDGATGATLFEGAFYDATAGTIQMSTGGADGDPFDASNTTALSAYTLRVSARGV